MKKRTTRPARFLPVLYALLAASLYALNAPFSKLLLDALPAALMAGFLYLGAGVGMVITQGITMLYRSRSGTNITQGIAMLYRSRSDAAVTQSVHSPDTAHPEKLGRGDIRYVLPMIALDIAAPILLMLGLQRSSAAAASLLNNFEIVATTLIAVLLFKARIPGKLWGAIGLITLACILLSMDETGLSGLGFSVGSLLIIAACLCWGFENNCTERLSSKDPMQIVVVKGIFSGLGSLITGFVAGERLGSGVGLAILGAMGLGFVAYGLSIYFYVRAQHELGAARTSAFYAVSPFIGGALSLIIYRQLPSPIFLAATAIMLVGTLLVSRTKDA